MCTKNCNGCEDCSEIICTSDVTCVDAEFQNIVLPEGSGLNDALVALESYMVDNPPADGTNGTNGTNGNDGTNAFKFVKEFTSSFDGDSLTITQVDLADAGVLPNGFIDGGLPQEFCDLHIDVWFLLAGIWYKFNTKSVGGEYEVRVNDTTGAISIILDVAAPENPVRVRVIILG